MSTELVLYNSDIANFITAVEKAEYVDYIPEIPIDDMLEKYQKPSTAPTAEIKTGIIQSLYETLKRADEDYQRITKSHFSGKLREDNALEKDIENFHADRCQMYADEIVQHIRGLIQLDGYDERIFGNWKNIAHAIKESEGMKKCLYLKQLMIHALTTIPPDIRYEQVEMIEPAITHQSRTVRG